VGAKWLPIGLPRPERLGLGALEAELHCRALEGLAVLEPNTLAQLEEVALAVGRGAPVIGQPRRHGAVDVDLGEPLEDGVVDDLTDGVAGATVGSRPGGSSPMPGTTLYMLLWSWPPTA
jgi:hypothetical protein